MTRCVVYRASPDGDDAYDVRWTPSIHMPKRASRISLKVTDVRVERVQDISEPDALAEGCTGPHPAEGVGDCRRTSPKARERFQDLWDRINARRGYGWALNPWVWVVTFGRLVI